MMPAPEVLNYHHLRYFWLVAREGGLVPAGRLLRLTHSTLSAQIHALEQSLGVPLFAKVGRRLELTEMGRVTYRYCEEIFGLGRELSRAVQGQGAAAPFRLHVGIADVVPKLIARRVLAPALALPQAPRLVCREAGYDALLADLGLHVLDIVISDAPVPAGSAFRGYNHLLGESGLTFFGAPKLAGRHRRGFPHSLHGARMLLPVERIPVRRALDQWFASLGIEPTVVAEFQDNALMTVFGAEGVGLFATSTAVEREIVRQFGVRIIGRTDAVRERYYAISAERRLKHPAVVAITRAARGELFGG